MQISLYSQKYVKYRKVEKKDFEVKYIICKSEEKQHVKLFMIL